MVKGKINLDDPGEKVGICFSTDDCCWACNGIYSITKDADGLYANSVYK
jgi:hypothetical protein